jgi:hypothetical protein
MPPATITPISVTKEAEVRLAELGMRPELEQIIEYTQQLASDLRSIDVVLTPACDPEEDPRIVLEVTKSGSPDINEPLWQQWRDWMIETFPPDVLRHFSLLTVYGANK